MVSNRSVAKMGILLLLLGSYRMVSAVEDEATLGQRLFVQCAGCHWETGEGSEALGAPNLTLLGVTYLRRQLEHFRSGIRGAHAGDTYGIQMALFAKALRTRENDVAVIQHIETLQDVYPENASTGGDLIAGKTLFGTCAACHGQNGQGIAALNAPRLTGLQAWYMERQLRHFKQGIRPSTQGDPYALQMAAATGVLASEQDIRDVVAYVTDELSRHDAD